MVGGSSHRGEGRPSAQVSNLGAGQGCLSLGVPMVTQTVGFPDAGHQVFHQHAACVLREASSPQSITQGNEAALIRHYAN